MFGLLVCSHTFVFVGRRWPTTGIRRGARGSDLNVQEVVLGAENPGGGDDLVTAEGGGQQSRLREEEREISAEENSMIAAI